MLINKTTNPLSVVAFEYVVEINAYIQEIGHWGERST